MYSTIPILLVKVTDSKDMVISILVRAKIVDLKSVTFAVILICQPKQFTAIHIVRCSIDIAGQGHG